jgi:predicted amidohydrolase YtcJ
MVSRYVLFLVSVLIVKNCFSQTPDIIVTNGKIFTSDEKQLYAEALAIKGNRIITVGKKNEIEKLAKPSTKLIDVEGRTVIPGLNDAHYHHNPIHKGYTISFPEDGREPLWPELKDSILAAIKMVPRGSFIFASMGVAIGTDSSIDRDVLDNIAPYHPLLINSTWGHVSYFNSAAIKALHLSETEPDGKGGKFGRYSNSKRLNGRAYENACNYLRNKLPVTDRLFAQSLKELGQQAVYFGVTTVQNMCTGASPETFIRILKTAPIPIRFRLIRWGEVNRNESLYIPAKNVFATGMPLVEISGTKWMLDGTPIERNAEWSVAYKDAAPWKGKMNFTKPEIRSMLKELSSRRDQPIFHVVGDVTAKTLLDELNGTNVFQNRRVRLEHGDGLLPELFDKAKNAHVIVVQNPTHFTIGDVWHQRFDGEVLEKAQPLRSLLKAGIPVAIGSDGPLNPYLNMMFACMHPFHPAEALTREEAVIAYTRGSAYAEMKDDKGMLVPGQLADLVVLSDDVFSIPLQQLPSTHSVLTMLDGKIIYNTLKKQ